MIKIDFTGAKEKEAQESFIAFLIDDGLNYFLERFYRDGIKVEYVKIDNQEVEFKLKGDNTNACSTSK